MNTYASETEIKKFRVQLAEISETDIAWFAGWVSADGSIQMIDHRHRPRIVFRITDRDPLDRFSELFGNDVGGPYPPSGFGKKNRYEWQISGWKAYYILERIYPWLSSRYQGRADVVLQNFNPVRKRGRVLTPQDAEDIKARLADGGWGIGRQLAREYGVTEGMITNIKKGRAWA